MPLSKYFKGEGEKVAANMKRKYGRRWKEVFYATAQKRKNNKKRDDIAPAARMN